MSAKMKMTRADYLDLRMACKQALLYHPGDIFGGKTPMRGRWDLFWLAQKYDTNLLNRLYDYLSDNHIDTALRQIIAEET